MASTTPARKQPAKGRPAQGKATTGPAKAPSAVAGMDAYDKVVWYSLHALLFLVPVAMSNLTFLGIGGGAPLTYDQFDIVKVFVMRACALVALGAWSWKMLSRGGKVRRTPVDWLIVIFLAWVTLTTFTSVSPATALFGKYRRFEGLLSFITYAVVFFLTVQLVDRPSRVRSLVRTLFFSSIIVSGYGLLQYSGLDPIGWGQLPFEVHRSFSTYGNPDLLGGYLVFTLILSLGLALTEEEVLWKTLYWVGFALNAFVWVTAAVRGAWVGGFAGLVVLAVAAVLAGVYGKYRPGVVDYAAAGVSVLGVIVLVARSLKSADVVMNVAARLKSITAFGEGSALTRFEIWQAAIAAIKAKPVVGWGADTFRLVFPMFKPRAYTKDAGYLSVADNVHDYPLQLASALGIPGFLLLYGLGGMVVWLVGASLSPIRGDVYGALGAVGIAAVLIAAAGCFAGLFLLKDRPGLRRVVAWAFFGVFGYVLFVSAKHAFAPRKGRERLLMAAVWAAALGYIVHLFFGLSVTGSTVLLWFCFALLLSPLAEVTEVQAPAWGAIGSVVAVVACSSAFLYNILYIQADTHYLASRIGGGQGPVAEVKAALALNPWNDMYVAELGVAYQGEMSSWVQQAQGGNQQAAAAAQESFRNAEASMKRAIEFVPTEYDNYVFLASLYNQAGLYFDRVYFTKAIEVGDKGIKVEPYGPAIRFQQALAYQYVGDLDKAVAGLRTASSMDPAYADPKIMLGDIARRKGDLAEAKRYYEDALLVAAQYQKAAVQQSLASVEASLKASSETTPAKK